jgi:hypothetical protein
MLCYVMNYLLTISIRVDHINIFWSLCNPLFQNLEALVDHRVHAPFHDFLVSDVADSDVVLCSVFLNQRQSGCALDWLTGIGCVVCVPTLTQVRCGVE